MMSRLSIFFFSREFTHRVKSMSMAKFSMEEANALQAGGNEVSTSITIHLHTLAFVYLCKIKCTCILKESKANLSQNVGSSS